MSSLEKKDNVIISIFVDDNPGVLARVVLLFSQRGYNIDSLTVSATDKENISRITISIMSEKNHATVDQIVKQIKKLIEVREVLTIENENVLSRDLALIRFNFDNIKFKEVNSIINKFDAHVIHLSKQSIVVELSGEKEHIDEFIAEAKKFNTSEICRTGIAAVEKAATIFLN